MVFMAPMIVSRSTPKALGLVAMVALLGVMTAVTPSRARDRAAIAIELRGGLPAMRAAAPVARLVLIDDRSDRNRGLDRAIRMVLRRTGGSYVAADVIGDDLFRVVVRISNRIVAYRVDLRTDSIDEE